MKKVLFFILFLCIGCSNNYTLVCSYNEPNSIYGDSYLVDTLKFKNNRVGYFERLETINVYSNVKTNINSLYRIKKKEGKLFKKIMSGGKYSVKKNSNNVSLKLILHINDSSDLTNFGINIYNQYNEIKTNYNNLGFECK